MYLFSEDYYCYTVTIQIYFLGVDITRTLADMTTLER